MTQISNQPTIKDFLLARIAEDEAAAREEDDDYADTTLLPTYDSDHQAKWNTARVLAECAAKRAIVQLHELEVDGLSAGKEQGCMICGEWDDYSGWGITGPCATIRHLAAVYSNHPDYRQEWALNG